MSVIKINALTVPAEAGDRIAQMIAARIGAVDSQDGFEGFELLKPTDGRNQWLVVTRWRDDASFEAWTKSPAFAHGHRGVAGGGGSGGGGAAGGPPAAAQGELWHYEVAVAAQAKSPS